jgi:hypothetical protein
MEIPNDSMEDFLADFKPVESEYYCQILMLLNNLIFSTVTAILDDLERWQNLQNEIDKAREDEIKKIQTKLNEEEWKRPIKKYKRKKPIEYNPYLCPTKARGYGLPQNLLKRRRIKLDD